MLLISEGKSMNRVIISLLLIIFTLPAFAQQDTIFRSLSATQVDEGVLINFTILGGITCSGVKIERSSDGILFYEIYEIPGVCGGLTSDQSYSYTDNFPLNTNVSYYRLDLGSLGLYSDIISISLKRNIFYFPIHALLNVQFIFLILTVKNLKYEFSIPLVN